MYKSFTCPMPHLDKQMRLLDIRGWNIISVVAVDNDYKALIIAKRKPLLVRLLAVKG